MVVTLGWVQILLIFAGFSSLLGAMLLARRDSALRADLVDIVRSVTDVVPSLVGVATLRLENEALTFATQATREWEATVSADVRGRIEAKAASMHATSKDDSEEPQSEAGVIDLEVDEGVDYVIVTKDRPSDPRHLINAIPVEHRQARFAGTVEYMRSLPPMAETLLQSSKASVAFVTSLALFAAAGGLAAVDRLAN